MEEVGDATKTGRSRPQGIGNVIQVGDTSGTTLWFRHLVTLCGNGEEGRRDTHRFSLEEYREAGNTVEKCYMGDALSRTSAGSRRK